ncbi:MAG: hypothetical protein U9N85_13605 [Bacteroidota bacterium]|nr:hypothetical protein [Bacteroidota bacterium]
MTKKKIIELLNNKTALKQQVFENTHQAFLQIKEILKAVAEEYNKELDTDEDLIEFRDTSEMLSGLRVSGDVLVFYMHSNIFDFDREHDVRKTKYLKNDPMAGYSGVINIYNFLSDSFKYERKEDLGYLIGRIFINKNRHYFVEGKRQEDSAVPHFGKKVLNKNALKKIIETAIAYSLQFDLLVPPYDNVKMTTVEHISMKKYQGQLKTGKRLGFSFRSDDVKGEAPKYTGG